MQIDIVWETADGQEHQVHKEATGPIRGFSLGRRRKDKNKLFLLVLSGPQTADLMALDKHFVELCEADDLMTLDVNYDV